MRRILADEMARQLVTQTWNSWPQFVAEVRDPEWARLNRAYIIDRTEPIPEDGWRPIHDQTDPTAEDELTGMVKILWMLNCEAVKYDADTGDSGGIKQAFDGAVQFCKETGYRTSDPIFLERWIRLLADQLVPWTPDVD